MDDIDYNNTWDTVLLQGDTLKTFISSKVDFGTNLVR